MLITKKDKDRFFSKVKKTNTCWLWTGGVFTQKYGRIKVNRIDFKAHRFSFLIHFGDIPKGMFVCHKCDIHECVNPNHLFLGTARENTQDMLKKGRHSFTGSRNIKSKLSEVDIPNIRNMLSSGLLQKEIAKKFNVCQVTISEIKLGHTWKHVIK